MDYAGRVEIAHTDGFGVITKPDFTFCFRILKDGYQKLPTEASKATNIRGMEG
jgi:hypothetical protein